MKEKSVGVELRCLNHQIRHYFENLEIKKQIDEITGTNGWIIGYLADHPDREIYQKDLEERFGMTRSTASKVLTLMERKGFIQRRNVVRDARLKKIVLTQKALKISERMARETDRFEEKLTAGFTEEELDRLFRYLRRMKDNIRDL